MEDTSEITGLMQEHDDMIKEYQLMKEKYYNVEIINDLITNWARRVVTKIDDTYTPEKAGDTEITELFKHISDRVCDVL
jgi:hypothetical protein